MARKLLAGRSPRIVDAASSSPALDRPAAIARSCGRRATRTPGLDGDTPSARPGAAELPFLSLEAWKAICVSLKLSRREVEITRLILAGYPELSIADALGISAHTVHSYIGRVYRKLRIRGRCELIVRLFETYVQLQVRSAS